jgi:RimJ/RimL family protein N-acetyltransferase
MIRALHADDAEAYFALRRQSLVEAPLAFLSSPADDLATTPAAVREQLRRAPESVVIGAFQPQLIGAVGVVRERHHKAAHKAHAWGMYVAPTFRRQGLAAALLAAAIAHARTLAGVDWLHLSVTSAAPEARRLYERAGFELWGSEPDALRCDGRSADEYHLALRL